MDETSYFQNALSSFVTDAACGGAVRHLTDIGYTLDQIVDRLDYPAPRAKVQRICMKAVCFCWKSLRKNCLRHRNSLCRFRMRTEDGVFGK